MKKPQKLQAEWQKEYDEGELTPQDLWDAGFRPRSNKYRMAVKEWKYHKRYYSVTLVLTSDEYAELKECPYREEEARMEAEERAEYERFLYLQGKYGSKYE